MLISMLWVQAVATVQVSAADALQSIEQRASFMDAMGNMQSGAGKRGC